MWYYQLSFLSIKISILGISGFITTLFIYISLRIISKKQPAIINPDYISEFIISIGISTLITSRLFYVLFNLDYYMLMSDIPNEILRTWNGGFSLVGAMIGFIISYALLSIIINNKSVLLLDRLSPVLMISLFILTAGKYFTQKIEINPTQFFSENGHIQLSDVIKDYTILQNTEILYESWCYLICGILILKLVSKGFRSGFVICFSITLFSIVRFSYSSLFDSRETLEFIATHALMIVGFSISIALILGLKLYAKDDWRKGDKLGDQTRKLLEKIEGNI